MEWSQILTIIGVNIAMFAGFATFLAWVMNKLDTDIKAVGSQIESTNRRLDGHAARIDQLYNTYLSETKAQGARTDKLYTLFYDEMKAQATRTDHLYGMFIDLLKEGKK